MELYFLESLKDLTHYIGISKDSKKRLVQHNKGKVQSTKNKRPWIIIYTEKQSDLKSAVEREKYLKSFKGVKEKRKIIEKYKKR
jgi:putative endonuclease